MPYPAPDVRNVTKPGGISVHVDFGAGFRHLGNIDISKFKVSPKNTDFEFKSQLSGEVRLADTFISERQENYDLPLQEVTPDHLRYFYLGGALETVGEGSAAALDQKVVLGGEIPASVAGYGISAVTVRQFLDYCLRQEALSAVEILHDNSVEADSAAGTPFALLSDPSEALYLGKNTPFKEFYPNLEVPGSYTGLAVKFWNGSAWVAVAGLGGAGAALAASGKVYFTPPTTWEKTTIIGVDAEGNPVSFGPAYFLKVTATGVTTPATANSIRQNAVRNTDYIIDPGQVIGGLQSGRIGRLAAGFLADGEEVKVSFTYTTWEALVFPVATEQYPVVAVRIDYLTLKGTRMRRHIPRAQLKPNGDMTFDPGKELQIPLLLVVLDDYTNNPDRPYGWKEILYS